MNKTTSQSRNNATFDMTFHLVLVTRYRNKVMNQAMLARCGQILGATLGRWRCEMLSFGGEADHVHVVFRAHPALNPSSLVNNLKTVTSRLLRKEFSDEIARFYWKPVFWSGAYYLGTTGKYDLNAVRRYVESQEVKIPAPDPTLACA